MKNIDVPLDTVLPITDAFFMNLLTADHINGNKLLDSVEEESGEGYGTGIWLDYMRHYRSITKPLEALYGGIILKAVSDDRLEATLLFKKEVES